MESLIRGITDSSNVTIKHIAFHGFVGSGKRNITNNIRRKFGVISHLTRLTFTLRPLDAAYCKVQVSAFTNFLESAINIEELVLDFGTSQCPRNLTPDCAATFDMLSKVKLNRLRLMALSNGSVQQRLLIKFFQNHSFVTNVCLDSLSLSQGSWVPFLNQMSKSLPAVKFIRLVGRLEDPELQSEGRFVCGEHLNGFANKIIVRKPGRRPHSHAYSQTGDESDRAEQIETRKRAARLPWKPCRICGQLQS